MQFQYIQPSFIPNRETQLRFGNPPIIKEENGNIFHNFFSALMSKFTPKAEQSLYPWQTNPQATVDSWRRNSLIETSVQNPAELKSRSGFFENMNLFLGMGTLLLNSWVYSTPDFLYEHKILMTSLCSISGLSCVLSKSIDKKITS